MSITPFPLHVISIQKEQIDDALSSKLSIKRPTFGGKVECTTEKVMQSLLQVFNTNSAFEGLYLTGSVLKQQFIDPGYQPSDLDVKAFFRNNNILGVIHHLFLRALASLARDPESLKNENLCTDCFGVKASQTTFFLGPRSITLYQIAGSTEEAPPFQLIIHTFETDKPVTHTVNTNSLSVPIGLFPGAKIGSLSAGKFLLFSEDGLTKETLEIARRKELASQQASLVYGRGSFPALLEILSGFVFPEAEQMRLLCEKDETDYLISNIQEFFSKKNIEKEKQFFFYCNALFSYPHYTSNIIDQLLFLIQELAQENKQTIFQDLQEQISKQDVLPKLPCLLLSFAKKVSYKIHMGSLQYQCIMQENSHIMVPTSYKHEEKIKEASTGLLSLEDLPHKTYHFPLFLLESSRLLPHLTLPVQEWFSTISSSEEKWDYLLRWIRCLLFSPEFAQISSSSLDPFLSLIHMVSLPKKEQESLESLLIKYFSSPLTRFAHPPLLLALLQKTPKTGNSNPLLSALLERLCETDDRILWETLTLPLEKELPAGEKLLSLTDPEKTCRTLLTFGLVNRALHLFLGTEKKLNLLPHILLYKSILTAHPPETALPQFLSSLSNSARSFWLAYAHLHEFNDVAFAIEQNLSLTENVAGFVSLQEKPKKLCQQALHSRILYHLTQKNAYEAARLLCFLFQLSDHQLTAETLSPSLLAICASDAFLINPLFNQEDLSITQKRILGLIPLLSLHYPAAFDRTSPFLSWLFKILSSSEKIDHCSFLMEWGQAIPWEKCQDSEVIWDGFSFLLHRPLKTHENKEKLENLLRFIGEKIEKISCKQAAELFLMIPIFDEKILSLIKAYSPITAISYLLPLLRQTSCKEQKTLLHQLYASCFAEITDLSSWASTQKQPILFESLQWQEHIMGLTSVLASYGRLFQGVPSLNLAIETVCSSQLYKWTHHGLLEALIVYRYLHIIPSIASSLEDTYLLKNQENVVSLLQHKEKLQQACIPALQQRSLLWVSTDISKAFSLLSIPFLLKSKEAQDTLCSAVQKMDKINATISQLAVWACRFCQEDFIPLIVLELHKEGRSAWPLFFLLELRKISLPVYQKSLSSYLSKLSIEEKSDLAHQCCTLTFLEKEIFSFCAGSIQWHSFPWKNATESTLIRGFALLEDAAPEVKYSFSLNTLQTGEEISPSILEKSAPYLAHQEEGRKILATDMQKRLQRALDSTRTPVMETALLFAMKKRFQDIIATDEDARSVFFKTAQDYLLASSVSKKKTSVISELLSWVKEQQEIDSPTWSTLLILYKTALHLKLETSWILEKFILLSLEQKKLVLQKALPTELDTFLLFLPKVLSESPLSNEIVLWIELVREYLAKTSREQQDIATITKQLLHHFKDQKPELASLAKSLFLLLLSSYKQDENQKKLILSLMKNWPIALFLAKEDVNIFLPFLQDAYTAPFFFTGFHATFKKFLLPVLQNMDKETAILIGETINAICAKDPTHNPYCCDLALVFLLFAAEERLEDAHTPRLLTFVIKSALSLPFQWSQLLKIHHKLSQRKILYVFPDATFSKLSACIVRDLQLENSEEKYDAMVHLAEFLCDYEPRFSHAIGTGKISDRAIKLLWQKLALQGRETILSVIKYKERSLAPLRFTEQGVVQEDRYLTAEEISMLFGYMRLIDDLCQEDVALQDLAVLTSNSNQWVCVSVDEFTKNVMNPSYEQSINSLISLEPTFLSCFLDELYKKHKNSNAILYCERVQQLLALIENQVLPPYLYSHLAPSLIQLFEPIYQEEDPIYKRTLFYILLDNMSSQEIPPILEAIKLIYFSDFSQNLLTTTPPLLTPEDVFLYVKCLVRLMTRQENTDKFPMITPSQLAVLIETYKEKISPYNNISFDKTFMQFAKIYISNTKDDNLFSFCIALTIIHLLGNNPNLFMLSGHMQATFFSMHFAKNCSWENHVHQFPLFLQAFLCLETQMQITGNHQFTYKREFTIEVLLKMQLTCKKFAQELTGSCVLLLCSFLLKKTKEFGCQQFPEIKIELVEELFDELMKKNPDQLYTFLTQTLPKEVKSTEHLQIIQKRTIARMKETGWNAPLDEAKERY